MIRQTRNARLSRSERPREHGSKSREESVLWLGNPSYIKGPGFDTNAWNYIFKWNDANEFRGEWFLDTHNGNSFVSGTEALSIERMDCNM